MKLINEFENDSGGKTKSIGGKKLKVNLIIVSNKYWIVKHETKLFCNMRELGQTERTSVNNKQATKKTKNKHNGLEICSAEFEK